MPLISIVVPVYSSAEYLRKCLDSILLATVDFPAEIIIVYDESTDDSHKICLEYLVDQKVKLIRGNGRGCGAARNAGIFAANGVFITFIDADDTLAAGFHYSKLKLEDGDWDFLSFRFRYNDTRGNIIKISREYKPEYIIGNHIFINACVSGEIYTVVWNKIYRLKFLKNNDIYFPEVKEWEDIVFTHRLAHSASKAKFSNIVVYDALLRDDSRSRLLTREFMVNAIETLRLDEEYFAKCQNYAQIRSYLAAYYIRQLMFFALKAIQKTGSSSEVVLLITRSEFFHLKLFWRSVRHLGIRDCLIYLLLKSHLLRSLLRALVRILEIQLY